MICRFIVLGEKKRSIARASCNVKEDARSSTVALGAASSNHLRVEAHLPKASMLEWGNRRVVYLMTLGSVQWLVWFEEVAHSTILWSDDPSGGRSCGV